MSFRRNQLGKNKVDVYSLRENHHEFIKNKKLTLKSQQRFRSENCNVFIKGVSKITLSDNNNVRIQSIDSIEILNKLNITI